jgi:hypothetical protein
MASELQITANRNNARKSTGPRSKAGREVSRNNSRRHGLAIDIENDPAFHDDIEKMADALSNGTSVVRSRAREFAVAEIDRLRIQKIRASLFETHYYFADAAPDRLKELNDKLAKLDRYERRAFSRSKSALRALHQAP